MGSIFSVSFRKCIFLAFRRIMLMDSIRNFIYEWAWPFIRSFQRRSAICDVGSRNSSFPAFLAWRGYNITAIDIDSRFTLWQDNIRNRWNVDYKSVIGDVNEMENNNDFDVVCALFSLQHAGDDDMEGYYSIGRILKPGGMLLTVNEYNSKGTVWHRNRDDGDLRIYGPEDVKNRIEKPIQSTGMLIYEKRYASADFKRARIKWESDNLVSNVCCICARKL